MTLGDLFQVVSENPEFVLFYFLAIPLTAYLAYLLGRDEGHLSPWKYLYSALVYMTTIPAIFAVILTVYYFLFEHRSILDTGLVIQVLPVLSMILTLWLIRLNVEFDLIPGFKKLSGLIIVIGIVLALMWIVDRMHFIAFTYMSFGTVLLILLGMIILFKWGWERVF